MLPESLPNLFVEYGKCVVGGRVSMIPFLEMSINAAAGQGWEENSHASQGSEPPVLASRMSGRVLPTPRPDLSTWEQPQHNKQGYCEMPGARTMHRGWPLPPDLPRLALMVISSGRKFLCPCDGCLLISPFCPARNPQPRAASLTDSAPSADAWWWKESLQLPLGFSSVGVQS